MKQNPIIGNEKEILLEKKERNSSFPKFYYPATWSTIHNRTHCSHAQSNKKKSWWRKKESCQQEYQLTSQSSNNSVESL